MFSYDSPRNSRCFSVSFGRKWCFDAHSGQKCHCVTALKPKFGQFTIYRNLDTMEIINNFGRAISQTNSSLYLNWPRNQSSVNPNASLGKNKWMEHLLKVRGVPSLLETCLFGALSDPVQWACEASHVRKSLVHVISANFSSRTKPQWNLMRNFVEKNDLSREIPNAGHFQTVLRKSTVETERLAVPNRSKLFGLQDCKLALDY